MTHVLNLDGLVGPNHNYGGLASGNLASTRHIGQLSSPKQAALQGLEKMWMLHNLGIPQGVIPPQQRPDLAFLHSAGFRGSTAEMLEKAYKTAPQLLEAVYSASAMWAANSATITPSLDSLSKRLQITPANLMNQLHRSLEAQKSYDFFRFCFSDSRVFDCHPPLPKHSDFADEGAANHIRLSDPQSKDALNLFVYGRDPGTTHNTKSAKDTLYPQHYPARQSRSACEAIIRSHQIEEGKTLLIQQNPQAIDQGAFHNDVVAVGHDNFLLLHQKAFASQEAIINTLKQRTQHWEAPLVIMEVTEKELSLGASIKSYLFNSQLVTLPSGELLLLAPEESRKSTQAEQICRRILEEENPVSQVRFINLKQSMDNGGGPACLRLQLPVTKTELSAVHPGILINKSLYLQLTQWVKKHYRDQLSPYDLQDCRLVDEIAIALEELHLILQFEKH